jgi:hypothetical protein
LSDNFRPDIVRGLSSRQGTQKDGTFVGASMSSLSKWHHYKRNGEEYFIEVQVDGTVQAWSPDGTKHTINVEDSAGTYLANSDPSSNLDLMTIGDYTFLINRDVVVEESSTTTDSLENVAIVYIQFKDYSQTTSIEIDGVEVAWHRSLDGGAAIDVGSVNPATVASKLLDGLQGKSGVQADAGEWGGTDITANFSIILNDNCLFISRIDGGDFTISVDDDVDGSNAVALFKTIEEVSLLPNKAPDDFKIKVTPPGGDRTENASFWLKATTVDGSAGNTLTWNETTAPDISVGINPATMPHVLVRESVTAGVATFTLRQGEWENREVGDDRTNPLPAFTGFKINSTGLMQNRLYFTAGESVTMSRSNEFFNFFRDTVQATLETDPISVYADSPQINYLKASIGFDGDLVFFSDTSQFLMPGDVALTSSNTVLRKTTTFETDLSVKPVASGDNIFFAINYGQFTGIREYFTDSVTDSKRARPVTDHVKEYIKGSPALMVASTNVNLLLIKAEDDNIIYTYDWLWQGVEKAQSAWGRILFPESDKIVYMAFVDDTLRLIIERDSMTVECESIDLGDADSSGLTFPVRLDRSSVVTMTKDDDTWKCSDPLPNCSTDDIRLVRSTDCYEEEKGTLVNFERVGSELWSEDDLSDQATCEVIAGVYYECKYTLTNPVVKDRNGQAMNLDKLIVGAYYVNYNTSGDIVAEVEDNYGNVRESSYSNRTLGGPENLIGFAPLVQGQHRIPIRKRSEEYKLTIKTDSHLPLAIRDFSLTGNFNRRGQRI